jgi:hypothetical protein
LIVWEYDLPSAASAVSWAVIANNVAALEILMNCGYSMAFVLVALGAVFRAVVGFLTLRIVGLEDGVWQDLRLDVIWEGVFQTLKGLRNVS